MLTKTQLDATGYDVAPEPDFAGLADYRCKWKTLKYDIKETAVFQALKFIKYIYIFICKICLYNLSQSARSQIFKLFFK